MDANELEDLLLEVLPPDGSIHGNLSARQAQSSASDTVGAVIRNIGETKCQKGSYSDPPKFIQRAHRHLSKQRTAKKRHQTHMWATILCDNDGPQR